MILQEVFVWVILTYMSNVYKQTHLEVKYYSCQSCKFYVLCVCQYNIIIMMHGIMYTVKIKLLL